MTRRMMWVRAQCRAELEAFREDDSVRVTRSPQAAMYADVI